MKSKNTILILCRSPKHLGGVVNYCNSIFKYYASDNFAIERFTVGKRPEIRSNIYYFLTMSYDLIRLFYKLFNRKYVLIHLNPSLSPAPMVRDGLFLLISRLFNIKTIVFWHGWEKSIELKIDSNRILLSIFHYVYNKADTLIVLASSFKMKLEEWRFTKEIIIETTTLDDSLLDDFDINDKTNNIKSSKLIRILFMSRLELAKGIIETIDAFTSLCQSYPDVELIIAGDGPDKEFVFDYVERLMNQKIKLLGYVSGIEKREILRNSHLMCLPTSYGEGLPVSMLEAMAFGMPILTKPVGGIPDHFIDGKNGYFVQSLDPMKFSELMRKIISDKDSFLRISNDNFNLAKKRFLSSVVAKRLGEIHTKIIEM